MGTIIVTGGSSGLGAACMKSLAEDHYVIDWSLATGVDVRNRDSIRKAIKDCDFNKLEALVNCAGINRLNMLPQLEDSDWDEVMETNAKALFLTTQELLPYLMNGGTVLNIVSNASHMPMTSSLVYNASKAAAAIMTKQLAREIFKTHNVTVFGISPNKLKGTHMSEVIDRRVCELRGWTEEQARTYQIASLPAGEETDPDTLAEFIAFLLSSKQRHKYLNGCIIPYGGPVL